MERFYNLKVRASSKKAEIRARGENSFEIRVKSPAQRGLANKEAIRLLAGTLGADPKKILLVKGAKSSSKIVRILRRNFVI